MSRRRLRVVTDHVQFGTEGGSVVWFIVAAVIALVVVAAIVAGRQETAYRLRIGKGRKPERSPGEDYLPPPMFGG